jgi:hypothetical protein
VWTWDFIADATVHGGALRMLTVLDEHTKEVHVLRPEQRIGSADVIALVRAAIAEHGAPEFIRSDNGPEPGNANHRTIHHINLRLRLTSKVEQFSRPSHT